MIVASAIHDWEWEDSAPKVSVLLMFLKKGRGMAYDIHGGNLQLDRVIGLSTRKTFMPAW